MLLSCSESYILTRYKEIVTTFTVSMIKSCHRLPRETVVSPYLVVLRTQLDNTLGNLI